MKSIATRFAVLADEAVVKHGVPTCVRKDDNPSSLPYNTSSKQHFFIFVLFFLFLFLILFFFVWWGVVFNTFKKYSCVYIKWGRRRRVRDEMK